MGTTTIFPEGRSLFIRTWAERPDPTTVKAYVDRFLFTDIGMGGSEWQ
jgi:hypothetical protein